MASFNINAGGDDGGYVSTTWSVTANYSPMGMAAAAPYYSFYRFININIPKGSTINSSYITFAAYLDGSSNTCNVRIFGNDIDNAVGPTNISEYNALELTTAYTDWSSIGAWTQASSYDTPSLNSVIQEIVDRESWSSGNAVMFLIYNNGSTTNATRHPASWNNKYYAKPILTITWTEPSGASFTQKVVMF